MKMLRLFNHGLSIRFNKLALFFSAVLCALLLIIFVFSAISGSYQLSFSDTFFSLIGQYQHTIDTQASLIIWDFRLPRSFVALLSGALFAISGALLQSMTRNPLADPSLLGISQGAALSVVTLTIFFPGYVDGWREIAAFIGAVSIAIIIQLLRGKGHPLKFILLGVGVAAFISAMISTLLTYSNLEAAMSALLWLAGSAHNANWHDVSLLSIGFICIMSCALYQARSMSVIELGDDVAIGLGISITRTMILQLSISVAAASLATAVVGPLGFIGLLAPHIATKIVRCGPANNLILTALVGAILVLLADIIGKTAFSTTQLAAGLVTSLVGAPLFAYLLIKRT